MPVAATTATQSTSESAAMSERHLEPVEWQRGDGLDLYQPKVTYRNGLSSALFERMDVWDDICMTKYWAADNHDGHPVVYRNRKRAIRVSRRHLKKVERERMHKIHKKEDEQ